MRLLPPLMIALTDCRFGSKRRALTLFAWLCCRPTTGPFPHTSHVFAIIHQLETNSDQEPINLPIPQGTIKRDAAGASPGSGLPASAAAAFVITRPRTVSSAQRLPGSAVPADRTAS